MGSHQLIIYSQILILVFLNLLNQFQDILWAFQHPFLTLFIFWIPSEYIYIYIYICMYVFFLYICIFYFFCAETQK